MTSCKNASWRIKLLHSLLISFVLFIRFWQTARYPHCHPVECTGDKLDKYAGHKMKLLLLASIFDILAFARVSTALTNVKYVFKCFVF